MTGWHNTPYSYVLFAGGVAAILCALYVWRRSLPNSRVLWVLSTALFVWLVGYGFEIGLTDLGSKIFWLKAEYLGIVTVPTAWFAFAVTYTGKERWLTPRFIALLAVLPLVILILAWTNGMHGLIWDRISIGPSGVFLALDHGPFFWVHSVYSYLLTLAGTGLVISSLSRSINLYRRQSMALLFAVMLPWISNVVYVLGLGPLPNLDWTPFAFLLSTVVFLLALFRYRLLDIAPVARDALVDGMSDGVLVMDLQNRIVDFNPAARRILSLPLEKAVGRDVLQSVGSVIDFPEGYRERENLGEFEVGDEIGGRCYEVRLSPLESGRGNHIGHLMTLHDVTERRRAEKEFRKLNESLEQRVAGRTGQLEALVAELQESERKVRRSEDRFRSLVQNASDIITVLEADGTILYESPSLERVLGYEPDEVVGNAVLDYVHPEDLQAVSEALKARANTQDIRPALELRFRTREGSWRYLEVVANNQLDNPSVGGIVVNSRDVTGRKEDELKLRQTEERYRSIFENAVEGIFQVSQDGRLLTANPSMARILGYESPEALIEGTVSAGDFFVEPEHGVEFFEMVQEQGSVSGYESRLRRRDGEVIWASKNARILRDCEGEMVGYEGSIEDVTEKKLAQQNIQRSLDMLLALHGAGQVLGSTLQAEEIGTRALEIMQRVSNLTAVVISTCNEDGELRVWRSVGLQDLRSRARYAPEAEAARTGALNDGRRSFRLGDPAGDPASGNGYLEGLCLPMRVRDRTIGVLEAYGENVAEDEAAAILGSLASQAASALENARLYRELTGRESQLQDLVGKLITAQEEERRRVAYEIHDGITQIAVAAHQQLQVFADDHPPGSVVEEGVLDRALELVRRTVGEARMVIADLRPTALDDFGLTTALRLHAESLVSEGWQVEFEESVGEERFDATVETALYRVAQEALTNVRKHARTISAAVKLERFGEKVRLEVRDRGGGFDPDSISYENGPGERVGLSSMRERIALLGGELEIRSRSGEGTSVLAEVPSPGGTKESE